MNNTHKGRTDKHKQDFLKLSGFRWVEAVEPGYKLDVNRDVSVVTSVDNTLSVIFAEADSFDQLQIFPSSTY